MILLAALSGILLGWLMNLAADFLPRFAITRPAPAAFALRPPAFWSLLAVQPRGEDFGLRLTVEAANALFLMFILALAGPTPKALPLAAVGAFFLLVALIDLKYRLVLNVIVYPAIIAAVVGHLAAGHNLTGILLGGILAFSIFFLTAWLKPGQLGGGDVKLAALLGFTFGFPGILWVLILGGGTGAVVSLYLLFVRRQAAATSIPYAPFLCFGALVGLLIVL